MNSTDIVFQQIQSEVNTLLYNEYLDIEIDHELLRDMLESLKRAMWHIVHESDCWKMAVSCGSMWVDIHDSTKLLIAFAISNAYCTSDYHGKA